MALVSLTKWHVAAAMLACGSALPVQHASKSASAPADTLVAVNPTGVTSNWIRRRPEQHAAHGELPVHNPQEKLTVFYSVESMEWTPGLLASVHSVEANTNQPRLLDIWVFATTRSEVPSLCNAFKISAHDRDGCSRVLRSGAHVHIAVPSADVLHLLQGLIPTHIHTYGPDQMHRLLKGSNFLRFAVDKLLPQDTDIAMYIDTDTIVMDDVQKLFSLARGRYSNATALMAARPEWHRMTIGQSVYNKTYAKEHFAPLLNQTVLNAGIMVLNLPLWRQRKALSHFQRWLQINQAVELFKGGNQVALNMALIDIHGTLDALDSTWNCDCLGCSKKSLQRAPKQCHILHWSGPSKPWVLHSDAGFVDIWRKYYSGAQQNFLSEV